jgi:hypothetical protein
MWIKCQLLTRRPGFIAGLLRVRVIVDRVALEKVSLIIFSVFTSYSSSYHCSIPIYYRPLRCAKALTRQHVSHPRYLKMGLISDAALVF